MSVDLGVVSATSAVCIFSVCVIRLADMEQTGKGSVSAPAKKVTGKGKAKSKVAPVVAEVDEQQVLAMEVAPVVAEVDEQQVLAPEVAPAVPEVDVQQQAPEVDEADVASPIDFDEAVVKAIEDDMGDPRSDDDMPREEFLCPEVAAVVDVGNGKRRRIMMFMSEVMEGDRLLGEEEWVETKTAAVDVPSSSDEDVDMTVGGEERDAFLDRLRCIVGSGSGPLDHEAYCDVIMSQVESMYMCQKAGGVIAWSKPDRLWIDGQPAYSALRGHLLEALHRTFPTNLISKPNWKNMFGNDQFLSAITRIAAKKLPVVTSDLNGKPHVTQFVDGVALDLSKSFEAQVGKALKRDLCCRTSPIRFEEWTNGPAFAKALMQCVAKCFKEPSRDFNPKWEKFFDDGHEVLAFFGHAYENKELGMSELFAIAGAVAGCSSVMAKAIVFTGDDTVHRDMLIGMLEHILGATTSTPPGYCAVVKAADLIRAPRITKDSIARAKVAVVVGTVDVTHQLVGLANLVLIFATTLPKVEPGLENAVMVMKPEHEQSERHDPKSMAMQMIFWMRHIAPVCGGCDTKTPSMLEAAVLVPTITKQTYNIQEDVRLAREVLVNYETLGALRRMFPKTTFKPIRAVILDDKLREHGVVSPTDAMTFLKFSKADSGRVEDDRGEYAKVYKSGSHASSALARTV